MAGRTFGRWAVVERAAGVGCGARWLCRCECGSVRAVAGRDLRGGYSTSCGCLVTKHGHATRGGPSPTYSSWRAMLRRCADPKHRSFKKYGGRGIKVCDAWRNSFEAFLAHMGERPPGTSIDRIDNDLGYSKGNCRWATRAAQTRHRRPFKQPGLSGEAHPGSKLTWSEVREIRSLAGSASQREIAARFGVTQPTVRRILAGRAWLADRQAGPLGTALAVLETAAAERVAEVEL
jgi:hypothetical protein